MKKYLDINVYESAIERIKYCFDNFDKIFISFSGGKDSGITLNLTLDYASKNNILHKVAIYHIDYECQYQHTTDYVNKVFDYLPSDVAKYWICLPLKAQCATSMFQNYWQPWDYKEKQIWARDLPKNCIHEKNFNLGFDYKINDYDFNKKFAEYCGKKYGKTCFILGIRTDESLNRLRAIIRKDKIDSDKNFITKVDYNIYNSYPIYDWNVSDIWLAYYKFEWEYNRLYDVFYLAGLSPEQMRVASPFNDCAKSSLNLYKSIDPNMWGRMISRVNGVNFTSIYGSTTLMGWKSITKPAHFTWKQYMYFLLDTLPNETKKNYLDKLETSIKFWKEKGGCLSDDVIDDLNKKGITPKKGIQTKRKTNKKPYIFEDYLDDVQIKDFSLIPSYKRMCVCIMKNDHTCKYMGFAQTKHQIQREKQIMEKYKCL